MSKILIIDNNKFICTVLESEFHQENIETIFSDGEDGLIKANNGKPDLIILELLLPKKDGFEILKELKKDPELRNISVIVFSVLGREKDIKEARKLGAVDCYHKDKYHPKELVRKIIEYLQRNDIKK